MAKEKGALAAKMKEFEAAQGQSLAPNTPAIIRIDGRAFHTFTRNFAKPWDVNLHDGLITGADELLRQIDGAVFAYIQSDEVSILIKPRPSEHAWFSGKHAKITSVTASVMTASFNRYLIEVAKISPAKWATFDARVFSLPTEEVEGYFVWRQRDAIRNSVLNLAQLHLGHREIAGLKRDALIARLGEEGVHWHTYEPWVRFGTCVRRASITKLAQDWGDDIWEDLAPTDSITRTMTLVENPEFIKDRRWMVARTNWG